MSAALRAAAALLSLVPLARAQAGAPDLLGLALDEALGSGELAGRPALAVDLALAPVDPARGRVVVWQVPAPGAPLREGEPLLLVASDELDPGAARAVRDVAELPAARAALRTFEQGLVLRVREQGAGDAFAMPTLRQLLAGSVLAHDDGSPPEAPRPSGGAVDVVLLGEGSESPTVGFREALIGLLLALAAGLAAGYYAARMLGRRERSAGG